MEHFVSRGAKLRDRSTSRLAWIQVAAQRSRGDAVRHDLERKAQHAAARATCQSVDDSRWYRFGFRRPIDGETPDMVVEVRLRVGGAGEVIVEWSAARLALNYRVSWKVTGSTLVLRRGGEKTLAHPCPAVLGSGGR